MARASTQQGLVGSLEINQDLVFQHRSWQVQRIGWGVMTLFALAALLGAFGRGGPLSEATAGGEGAPLRVEYERFLRRDTSTTLRLEMAPSTVADGKVRVWLDRDFLALVHIEQVSPTPDQVEISADRLTYVFNVGDPSSAPAAVFNIRPERAGLHEGRAGLADGPLVSFPQFVYP